MLVDFCFCFFALKIFSLKKINWLEIALITSFTILLKCIYSTLLIQAFFLLDKINFWRNYVTYRMPCHTIGHFVFWYHHVTYNLQEAMPVVIEWSTTSAMDLRGCFLLSGIFYLTILLAVFRASLGAGSSTSKLAGPHADLQNIALARLFVWITTIHKRGIVVGSIQGLWLTSCVMKNLPLAAFKLFSR